MVGGTPLLRGEGLGYVYPGDVRALADVSIEVAAGELLVVIGPNGSGKSTLLRSLAGLLDPQSGRVTIDGSPLATLRPRERARHIGVVPQFLASLPDVSVLQFVLGGRYAWSDGWQGASQADVDVAHGALARCDIDDVHQRFMNELSGGQRQRVLIARSLAQEASILLVDEPTNSLDPEHQIRVFGLIAELAAEGKGVVVVTHDLNLASQFASRVMLLDHGGVRAEGSVLEVLRPEILNPVYGEHLHFGTLRDRNGVERPYVIPWFGGS